MSHSNLNNYSHLLPQRKKMQTLTDANLAPGWRRVISNTEVVYVSPTGATLRTHGQIKDYLLSRGTCKCGLPCPLKLECFFNFNSQIPNTPLHLPIPNELDSKIALSCLHQTGQQNMFHEDNDGIVTNMTELAVSDALQANGKKSDQTSVNDTKNKVQEICDNLSIDSTTMLKNQTISGLTDERIANRLVENAGFLNSTHSPTSRKIHQSLGNNDFMLHIQKNANNALDTSSSNVSVFFNERVPPLPQAHFHKTTVDDYKHQITQQTMPCEELALGRLVKTRSNASIFLNKNRPNFKNDLNGYLEHQTAILHSSIINAANNQEVNGSLLNGNDPESVETDITGSGISLKIIGSNDHHVVQNDRPFVSLGQNQHVYPLQTADTKGTCVEKSSVIQKTYTQKFSKKKSSRNTGQSSGNMNPSLMGMNVAKTKSDKSICQSIKTQNVLQKKHQLDLQLQQSPSQSGICHVNNFIYNGIDKRTQRSSLFFENVDISKRSAHIQQVSPLTLMKSCNQNKLNASSLNEPDCYKININNNKNFNSNQPITETISSSHPFTFQKQTNQIVQNKSDQMNKHQMYNNTKMGQATITAIDGQTITHCPNSMVRVDHNCDNIAPFKITNQFHLQTQNLLLDKSHQLQKSVGRKQIMTSADTSMDKDESSCYQNMQQPRTVQSRSPQLPFTMQTNLVQKQFNPQKGVASSQDSPVSSSTTFNRATPDKVIVAEFKGPAQVGAISTSNQSPIHNSSPVDSPEFHPFVKVSPPVTLTKEHPHDKELKPQTTFATISPSLAGGKMLPATLSTNDKSLTVKPIKTEIHHFYQQEASQVQQQQFQLHRQEHQTQQIHKLPHNSIIPSTTNFTGIQLQPVVREPGSQIIMTSTGQLIVMPAQTTKSSNQMVIDNSSANNILMNNQQSLVINQQSAVGVQIGNSMDVISNQSNTTNIIQSPGSSLVIQNSGIVQTGQNIIQSPNNLMANSNANFILNSPSTIQPMILNNSNIIQQNSQNLMTANPANIIPATSGSNIITATGNNSKMISGSSNLLHNPTILANQSNAINNQVISNSTNIISPSIGQQAVVLNTLSNGYVIQPNFPTVDGQILGQLVNSDNSTTFLQQQRQIFLGSPETKRKAKKRKCSMSSPTTPTNISPQLSPTIQRQSNTIATPSPSQATMVQLTAHYPAQGFQIGPSSIQGIAMVNKNSTSSTPQQQILFQNGQLVQPVGLIGQQLLVSAGLVVTPDATLLQIQNVGSCSSIITPQGMVLRAPSPQNKNFLPTSNAGQQFIVSGNGQMSPISQLFGTPMSLVVPQSNAGAATFVQQNTTIVQQQTTMMSNSDNTSTEQSVNQTTASPPDTTTHSPRSPERPPSEASGGSDMVQCVSSSEPDSEILTIVADSAVSPANNDHDRVDGMPHQLNNTFTSSDTKIRRVQMSPQFISSMVGQRMGHQMRPDSLASTTSTTTSLLASGTQMPNNGGFGSLMPSFSVGELIWGAARGHHAWPGKVVNPPDGTCTPSDSTWVQWFGGRSNVELVAIISLKSLSEGLDTHHKAQKDSRKSRKLNSQLERAIQEAMSELDRITSTNQVVSNNVHNAKTKPQRRQIMNSNQPRTKPVKIAPAPFVGNCTQMKDAAKQEELKQMSIGAPQTEIK